MRKTVSCLFRAFRRSRELSLDCEAKFKLLSSRFISSNRPCVTFRSMENPSLLLFATCVKLCSHLTAWLSLVLSPRPESISDITSHMTKTLDVPTLEFSKLALLMVQDLVYVETITMKRIPANVSKSALPKQDAQMFSDLHAASSQGDRHRGSRPRRTTMYRPAT
jgi:hypothetical protein